MRDELLTLCKMHDNIKDSEIRLKGIDGEILPPNSKDRYHWLMRNFSHAVYDYFEKYQRFNEIKATIEWGKERNYNIQEAIDAIYECYAKYDDDEFIAALDFMTLSKLHYLIEYAYFQLNKEYYTKEFGDRLQ